MGGKNRKIRFNVRDIYRYPRNYTMFIQTVSTVSLLKNRANFI